MAMKSILENISRNEQGFMLDWTLWSREIAEALASEENMTLTEVHLSVLLFLRDFYRQFNNTPPIRVLVKLLRDSYPSENYSSTTLYALFPQGPLKQASKLAGLPKPARCI